MNKISFIIEFDEISKTQEGQLTEFLTKTGIKFQVLESDNDLKKYKKYKDAWNKLKHKLIDKFNETQETFYLDIIQIMEQIEKSDSNE